MARRFKTDAKRAYDQALGQRIARARKMKGMTQRQLAEAIGISATFLAYLETGRGSCTMYLFEKIQGTLRSWRAREFHDSERRRNLSGRCGESC